MDNEYYILENGEKIGPFTFDELTEMEIGVHTSILSPLNDSWQDACDLPELYPYFEAQGIYLPTGDNLASFWWRLLAYAVDYVILSIVMQYVFMLLAAKGISFHVQSIHDLMKLSPDEMFELQFITSATLIIYNSVCEASPMRGSIGKRLCKLVVVDVDGERLSYLNALLRSFGKALSIFFAYLGFISIFFTEHQQAVHDLIAKTYVVKRD